MSTIDKIPLLPWEDSLIPGAESLPFTLRIVAARGFAQPSLLQKFGAKFPNRGVLVNFNVTEKREAFANGTGRTEFPRRQAHKTFLASAGYVRAEIISRH